jgi:hypothetical protein
VPPLVGHKLSGVVATEVIRDIYSTHHLVVIQMHGVLGIVSGFAFPRVRQETFTSGFQPTAAVDKKMTTFLSCQDIATICL